MKKFVCTIIAMMLVLTTNVFAFAEESVPDLGQDIVEDPVVLDFRDYSYTLDNVSKKDVTVVKTVDDAEAIEYEVSNKKTPEIVDTIRVDFVSNGVKPKSARASDIRSTFFSKYKTIKNTKTNKVLVELQYKVRVDYYESGSFRSFYGADTPNLLIASSTTSMNLTNVAKSVKSTTGKYPTESLTYAYSANLKTSRTYTSSSTTAMNLVGGGFSATGGTSTSKYYYRIVSETGTIDLY